MEDICETCGSLATDIEVDHMLLLAADNGCFNCLTTLIKTGANVNITSKGKSTPLINASKNGHDSCVTALIEAGADVNTSCIKGRTALIFAAK